MIDYILKDLFLQDSIDHQMVIETDDGIIIDNTMLHSEEFSLDESVCREEQIVFGSCESSGIQFKVSNVIEPLIGKWLTVKIILDGNVDRPFVIGRYKVDSDKPTADRSWRDVTAYDVMKDIMNVDVTDWYNGLTFPMSVKNFRNSLFSYLGINQEWTTLANDNVILQKDADVERLSGKTLLNKLLEFNGTLGHITRDNKFRYIEFSGFTDSLLPSNTLYPANDLFPSDASAYNVSGKYTSANYEDYECKRITKCSIKQSGEDGANIVSEGAEGNEYLINDNFLLYGLSDETLRSIARNFLGRITNLVYRPYSCTAKGNPCLEVGDRIRINTQKQIINSFVFERHLKGVQALMDEFSSNGKETYTQDLNSQSETIMQIKGSINRLERTAEHTLSEIENLDEKTKTKIEQTSNTILAEVSKEVKRAEGEEESIRALLELKIDKDDSGKIISLINGSADNIHFNANNMFTVDAPNLTISEDGTISANNISITGGKIEVDTGGTSISFIKVYNGGFYVEMKPGGIYFDGNSFLSSTQLFLKYGSDYSQITAEGTGYFTGSVTAKGGFIGNATSSDSADYASTLTGSAGDVKVGSAGLIPDSNGLMRLGGPGYKWSEIFAETGTINTSDRNEKKSIEILDEKYIALFERLIPVSFQFIDGTSGRTHIGFISQDVESAMEEVGLSDLDFAGFCKDEITGENGKTQTIYGLRYSEFVALNTKMIQKTREELVNLKRELIKKGVLDE